MDAANRIRERRRRQPFAGNLPVGIVLLVAGTMAFFWGGASGQSQTIGQIVASGLSNPLFLLGVPLGLYLAWPRRAKTPAQSLFYFKGDDGTVYGPCDRNSIAMFVSQGRILPHTPISQTPEGPWRACEDLMNEAQSSDPVAGGSSSDGTPV